MKKRYDFDARKKRLIKRYRKAVAEGDKVEQEFCSWALCHDYGQSTTDFPPP